MVLQKEIKSQEVDVKQMFQLYQEEREQFDEDIREMELIHIQQQQAANKMDPADIDDFIANGQLKKYLKLD
jgi:3-oxoacyl-[acyl-carrier-protein] synthase III